MLTKAQGQVVVKSSLNKIEKTRDIALLWDYFSNIDGVDELEDGTAQISLSNSGSFNREEAFAALEKLNGHTVSGLITLESKNGARWRFRFDEKLKKWCDEDGILLYEESSPATEGYPAYIMYVVMMNSLMGKAVPVRAYSNRAIAQAYCDEMNGSGAQNSERYSVNQVWFLP